MIAANFGYLVGRNRCATLTGDTYSGTGRNGRLSLSDKVRNRDPEITRPASMAQFSSSSITYTQLYTQWLYFHDIHSSNLYFAPYFILPLPRSS